GSMSMASIVTFSIILFLFLLAMIDKFFKSINVGRTFSVIVIISAIAMIAAIYYSAFEMIELAFNKMGRDISFTGRTELWKDLLHLSKDRMWFGYGFAAFWVFEPINPKLLLLFEKYVWLPNEAHLGYLDIVMQIGVVGLLLFSIAIAAYFIKLIKLNTTFFGTWLIIAILILNLQESTLLFPRVFSGEVFLISYLALYQNLDEKQHSINPRPKS
ncbi:MAG: O-antigen ligase family protein, partial [bacterium]|nr:O-antigen ligase family protein [bacterium]